LAAVPSVKVTKRTEEKKRTKGKERKGQALKKREQKGQAEYLHLPAWRSRKEEKKRKGQALSG